MILRLFFVREVKKFPAFFALLSFTILLGTLGLTGISLVSQEVQEKLQSRADELLTSDFAITARRDLLPTEQAILHEETRDLPHQRYKVVEIYSMVTEMETGQARLVELRGVESNYPFHGKVKIKDNKFDPGVVYVAKDLEELWKISTRSRLRIGEIEVAVSGVIEDDTSVGLRGFSLAPRVQVPLSLLEKSGLLRPGATGNYAYHFHFTSLSKEEVRKLKSRLYKRLTDPALKVVLPEDSSEQTGRVINNVTNFMSLAALIGLILSLVGIFYLYQSHLLARLKDLCLLNLHGLSKTSIVRGILLQFSAVFFLVFVAQLVLIVPLYRLVAPILSQNLGIDLGGGLSLHAVLTQLPFLYGLSLTMLVPLLLGLTRTSMGAALKAARLTMGRFRFYDFLPFVVMLWAFAWYLSNSLMTGNLFFGGLLLVFLFSTFIVRAIQWGLKKFLTGRGLRDPYIEVGVALRNLSRSGHKLTLSFLSLAMGATLICLILQLDRMIGAELALEDKRPGLFIFDIQEEQLEELLAFATLQRTPLEAVTPMIRGRLEKVNGQKFKRPKSTLNLRTGREDDEENRLRNTGLNITYRSALSPAEKIISGEPFPSTTPENRLPLISLEKRWAERMGLSIGDQITFDIQGVELEAKVHNLRDVKWTSFYPNFFVTIEPGVLDGAPKTFLAVLGAGHKNKKRAFQSDVALKFPNISFIDVEELMGKLGVLFQKSRAAIEIIAFLSLGVGLVILYGLSHDQVYRRHYDLALMKTLGFTAGQLRVQLLLEFGVLFLAATGLGLLLGWLMAQVLGKEVFKLPFTLDITGLALPGVSLTILCLMTILISSWRAVRAKPKELLSDS